MSKKNDTNSIVLDRDISQPEGRLKRKKPPLRKKKIDEDIKSGEGKQKGNENLEDNSRNKNINNNVNNTNDNCQKHNSQEDNQNKSNISQESEQDNVREFEDTAVELVDDVKKQTTNTYTLMILEERQLNVVGLDVQIEKNATKR